MLFAPWLTCSMEMHLGNEELGRRIKMEAKIDLVHEHIWEHKWTKKRKNGFESGIELGK